MAPVIPARKSMVWGHCERGQCPRSPKHLKTSNAAISSSASTIPQVHSPNALDTTHRHRPKQSNATIRLLQQSVTVHHSYFLHPPREPLIYRGLFDPCSLMDCFSHQQVSFFLFVFDLHTTNTSFKAVTLVTIPPSVSGAMETQVFTRAAAVTTSRPSLSTTTIAYRS